MMNKTNARKIILLLICFCSSLAFQPFYLYFGQDIEPVNIHVGYYEPSEGQVIHTSFNFNVIRPFDSESEKLPVCILLHGDHVDHHVMNNLKFELLENGYMIVLAEIDEFTTSLFYKLNETLNYLLEKRDDVNVSQIGIMGHSQSADYVLNFARMRNDSINAVICGNFASSLDFFVNYLEFYLEYSDWNTGILPINLPSLLKKQLLPETFDNMTLGINETNIKNVLLISDSWDHVLSETPETILSNLSGGLYTQNNRLYGNFENGTARKMQISTSGIGHAATLFSPEIIHDEVSWFNNAFGIDNSVNDSRYNSLLMHFRIYLGIFIVILLFIFGFWLVKRILVIIPDQGDYLKKTVNIIFNKIGKEFKFEIRKRNIQEPFTFITKSPSTELDEKTILWESKKRKNIIKQVFISLLIGDFLLLLITVRQYWYIFAYLFLIIKIFLFNWKVLPKYNSTILSMTEGKEFIYSLIKSSELYILSYGIINICFFNTLGLLPFAFNAINLFILYPVLFYLNQFCYYFFQLEYSKKKYGYFKIVGLNLCLFNLFLLPGFYFDPLSSSVFILIAFINPFLFSEKYKITTVSLFNFLILTFGPLWQNQFDSLMLFFAAYSENPLFYQP